MAAWLDRRTVHFTPRRLEAVKLKQLIEGENILGPSILEYIVVGDVAAAGTFQILNGTDTEGSSDPFMEFSAVTPPRGHMNLDGLHCIYGVKCTIPAGLVIYVGYK